jgi:Mg2+/Co2+ transporter CorB
VLLEILSISVVFVLLSLAACFSACETAITGFSKPRMYKLAKEGNKKAEIICDLQEDVDLVLSSILTCNTILNSLSVSFATAICINIWGQGSVVVCSIIMSVLVVFWAEVLPKMFTISNPDRILLKAAPFMKFVFKILRPINNVMGMVARKIISVFTNPRTVEDDYESSLEELRGAIDLHKSKETEDTDEERAMLRSILDLGQIPISNIMIHRKNVTMMCIDNDIDSLVEQITMCPFTRIPLWSGNRDNIIGVLHVKDLLKLIRTTTGIDIASLSGIVKPPWFIPESTDLLCQLREFKKKCEHFALVVDEYGGFLGIVTLEDILEEIVGDISDEHDVNFVSGIRRQDDGSYIVDGTVSVRDFNREMGTNFSSGIAATIAGIVVNSMGIIPEIGQIFILFGYRFEILKRKRNQVTLLRISKVEPV